MPEQEQATFALAGQPNVGKSTVFNLLTGLNQHVGNWPGKTVEQRTGTFVHDGMAVDVVDLPGTYSLTAASPEELIARDYVIRERPDVVIVIINAASLERNLYLVAEMLALPAPLVLGLNMVDVARQEGFEVDADVLSAAIGIPVVPMVAARGIGVHDLVDAAIDVVRHGPSKEPNRPQVREDHQEVVKSIEALVADYVPDTYPIDWVALKLFEGDAEITRIMAEAVPAELWAKVQTILRQHEDAIIAVASGRYEWIRRMTRAALQRPRTGRITLTQRLDNVATHPFWGLILLAVVLAATFGFTYAIGVPLQDWMADELVGGLADLAQQVLAPLPDWFSGLIVDGIIGGVGSVLTFVPILAIFFIAMGLLEDVGYMARAAYVMDRFMHAIGLHGKSFMPLFLGFGCNVPAIMGARIIESRRSRLLTIMLAPLVPCTARLAVLAVLVPIFFPANATLVSWALTGLPLVMLAISGVVINQLFLRGEQSVFIMELPLYHQPHWKTLGILVWQRLLAFIRKAGTVILVVSIVVWALATLPHGEIDTSYLAAVGRFLEPVGLLMGLQWRPLVALLTSFIAKENAIATLGVLYNVGESAAALSNVLAVHMTPASGLAFLVFQMLFIPCVATLAVIRQETASWKWVAINMLFLTLLSFVGAIIVFQVAVLWL
jgi:ferrous iron transport protein B